MLLFGQGKYRMSDLVERTGFAERQIRFYIAQKLVPGAESRGAAAVYGQPTLDRLLLIRHLKEIRVKPANRALTLDEMRQTMDALGAEGAMRLTSDMAQLQIIDTDELLPQRLDDAMSMECQQPKVCNTVWDEGADYAPPPPDLGELGPLLHRLLDTLDELTASLAIRERRDAKAWRRIAGEDLEIQVREPADLDESASLGRHAAALRALLGPYPGADG
ncbi:MAG: MerR family transcriptional regulator [Candidatus Krumholzibacteriia bacterium]